MRLYSRTGATALGHGEVTYEPGDGGAFDLPDDLAGELVTYHLNGQPLWETDLGRRQRLAAEELERRKDPATLLDAVNQLVAAAKAVTPEPEAAKPSRRKAAADPGTPSG